MNTSWWKQSIIASLSIITVLALAGCGGNTQSTSSNVSGKSAKIAFISDYTGPGAAYGQSMKEGNELAVEEINNTPNTKIKIDMKEYDAKLQKTEAINAMKKAIEQDKVLAIEGPMTTGESMAADPIAQQSKVVAFTTASTGPDVTKIGDYIFRYQKVFKDAGIDIVATETFADKDTDFSAQLTKIQAANPDVIAVEPSPSKR